MKLNNLFQFILSERLAELEGVDSPIVYTAAKMEDGCFRVSWKELGQIEMAKYQESFIQDALEKGKWILTDQTTGTEMTLLVHEVTKEFMNTGEYLSCKDINSGDCDRFAEELENRYAGAAGMITNDNFVTEKEGSDGWNGDGLDQWDKYWLTEYESMPPKGIKIEDLGQKIGGYHAWVYCEGKHFDAECPGGVVNFFNLPFFKRELA